MSRKKRTDEVCTALHVVKGAIVTVLKTPLTTSVRFDSAYQGRVCVQYAGTPPTEAQVKEIQRLSNKKIKDSVEIKNFEIDRKEAESKYTTQPVNGTYIYDKQPVPEKITSLSLVEIDNWTINCCPGKHLGNTNLIPGIKIDRINARPQKEELEFIVVVTKDIPQEETPATPATASSTPQSTSEYTPRFARPEADVNLVTEEILDKIVDSVLKVVQKDDALTKAVASNAKSIRQELEPEILLILSNMRNNAYASGFSSHLGEKRF
eukprot:TRINITY_DN851_c0_g1_i1.p1 TRINITY_DN851_c0_g1~~TRINITY_DN851_c0_g1_i1.p1  ORF type:complete len:265 (-),score=57.57 TRINITY_DN851_c0_g1_i1:30-824(-)